METRYELLSILPTTLTDDEVGVAEQKVQALITKYGGTVQETRRLGKFRFAYPIKHQRHGYYVLSYFTAEGSAVAKIEEALRIAPEVVRHLILRADEAGSDKFDLVQFAEVVVESSKEERARRKERASEKDKDADGKEVKEESETEGEKTDKDTVPSAGLSAEELEKKIEKALNEDANAV